MPAIRLPVVSVLSALLLGLAANAAMDRTVVYITNWSQYRPGSCSWRPKDLDPNLATHVVYAFAFLNPDFSPKIIEWNDDHLYSELQSLKKINSSLKTLIAIGGWTMNVVGSGYEHLFSDMVATPQTRSKFISSTIEFCQKYGFDGLDLDWEYPGRTDRGGRPSDKAGFAALLKEFRAEVNRRRKPGFLLTLATGAGASAYAGLDLPNIHPYVDFINLMAYDYRGAWDQTTGFNAPWQDKQTGVGIQQTLDHYINTGKVPPSKLVLGLAVYGRSWTLADPTKNGLGAPAYNPGEAGRCTRERGFLAWREIKEMIDRGAKVVVDTHAKAAYLAQGSLWVSFDTAETLTWKINAGAARGLGGKMVWAADLDEEDYTLLKLIKREAGGGPDPPALTPPTPPGRGNKGFCGRGKVNSGQCRNPKLCCNSAGRCGKTKAFCGRRCIGGPCYGDTKPKERYCGRGRVNNGICRNPALCCSAAGRCGKSKGFCGKRCIGGPCHAVTTPAPSPPPRSATPCGDGVVGGGACANARHCCSKWGWCGPTAQYCGRDVCMGGPCALAVAASSMQWSNGTAAGSPDVGGLGNNDTKWGGGGWLHSSLKQALGAPLNGKR